MADRWTILVVLFLARTTMGFQFQSVAAVSPVLVGELGMTYAALGTLIGLYLFPGIGIALPGGWLGQRFGDKRVVLAGLFLMAAGGAITGASDVYAAMAAGRVIAGTGAVLLNVLLTKMVTDWFAGREIVTAMGTLIASWPLGIGLALVLAAPLAKAGSWPLVMVATAAASAAALLFVGAVYRPPPNLASAAAGGLRIVLSRRELGLAVLAGLVWTFYNVGLIIVLGFGPEFLTARGYSLAAAGATVSTVTWLIIPVVPLGAWLAERIARPYATMVLCFTATGALIALLTLWDAPLLLLVAIGVLFGPPAGLIMALPAAVLKAQNRAVGMGVYFTCYYAGMGVLPGVAGWTRDLTGNPAAPLLFGAAMMAAALAALVAFRALQNRAALAEESGT